MVKLLFYLVLSLSIATCVNAANLNLPRDTNGWTVFTPSVDSRILYVSSSGNDTTGATYSSSSQEVGADPFSPSGSIQSFATFSAAFSRTRAGYPDWILIKRGDAIVDRVGYDIRSGRSVTEPFLIGSYGSSGNSPTLNVRSGVALAFDGGKQFFAVSGVDFYADTRDPGSPNYVGGTGSSGISIVGDADIIEGALIEGCKFRFFTQNLIIGAGQVQGFSIRRSIFVDSYSVDSHSQGLFVSRVSDMVLSENVFDHNGWLVQSYDGGQAGGQATIFNHNTYFSEVNNVTFDRNIFMRPSSLNTKFTASSGASSAYDILIDNNLYIDGEGGISAGGNTTDGLRFKNITVRNNLITNMNMSRSTDRDLAFAIGVQDWDGGTVAYNLIINSDMSDSYAFGHQGTSRNIYIDSNTVYNFKKISYALYISSETGSDVTNMVFSRNSIQIPQESNYTIKSHYNTSGKWTFMNNIYHSDEVESKWFYLNGSDQTLAQWQSATGDNSTAMQVTFPDSTRSIETYMTSLGETNTIDAFIAKCRLQDRYNWDTAYTAPVVNQWIKAGFGMGGTKYKNVKSITQETP